MRVPVVVTMMVALMLAGCASPPSQENEAEQGPDPFVPDQVPTETKIMLERCTDALLLATMDTAAAQALLPHGFTAADGSAFLLGPTSSPAAESGQTIAYFDSVACMSSSLDGDSVGVGHNGILVRTPDLGSDHELESATYEFYIVEQYYSHAAMVALLSDRGVAVVRPADVQSDYAALAPPLGSGSATVGDAEGAIYSFAYESGVPAELDGLVRLWYVSSEGVGFVALRFDAAAGALGTVTGCTAREGSFAAELVGTSCAGGEGAAGIWDGMSYDLRFNWFQGVHLA